MIKKILSCITALCIMGIMPTAVSAVEYDAAEDSTLSASDYGIMPLYDNVFYVSSGISINSENKAICTGTYSLYDDYKAKITMTLMKSSNGTTGWSTVESWSRTYTGAGPWGISQPSTNALSSSYYYRTYVQVQIYNSSNKVIETVSCFSNPTHL